MESMLMIERPTLEHQIQRLIEAFGYHDAEYIPVEAVFQMFTAFFKYEHQWNENLSKMFEDHLKFCTSLPRSCAFPIWGPNNGYFY